MRKKKIFFLSFVIIFFTISILFIKIFFGQGLNDSGNGVLFSKGQNLRDLSVILTDKGLISSQLVFKIGIRIIGGEEKLQAGEYYIQPHESMYSIYKKIVEGDTITYSLTVPEGLTNKQIFSILEANPQLTGDIDELQYGKEGIFLPGIPIGQVRTDGERIFVSLFSNLSQITFVNVSLGNSKDQNN